MDPDTETYQQALSDGAAWAREVTRVLGWIVVAVVCGLGAIWAAGTTRRSPIDRVNYLLAWLNHFPGFGPLVGWLVTRRLTALVGATFGLALGVYLGAFGMDGGWLKRHSRFRARTPHQVGRALAAWAGRVHES